MGGPAETRERILAAATAVFAERGYHGTSVDEIVRASGTSKGAFYFHYPNKEGIFLALVEEFAGRLLQSIYDAVEAERGRGAIARVRAALRAGISGLLSRPQLARIFLIEAVGLNPSFEVKRREIYRALAKLIAGYLDAAIEEGDLPEQESEWAAYVWLGAISETVVHALEADASPAVDELTERLARHVLQAVGWRPPAGEPARREAEGGCAHDR